MYHSVIFGDKNTWDDWHLVPETRPVINPPEPKFSKVDIPSGDGDLDLTNALSPYTYYNNRTGSIDFIVVNDMYCQVDHEKEWYMRYTEIMNYLHGKKMRMILEDDKQYFYEGRFSVNQWESDVHYSKITIDYDVTPYKWNLFSSLDDWLWDPFNFVTGVIPNPDYKDVSLPGPDHITGELQWVTININRRDIGVAPICPNIHISYVDPPDPDPFIAYETYFQIPGYEGYRTFVPSDYIDGVLQIPEYTFRKDMTDDQLKIVAASNGVGLPSISLEIREGCF